jgi:DNA uptake protein ComE-like DNA-binding protein
MLRPCLLAFALAAALFGVASAPAPAAAEVAAATQARLDPNTATAAQLASVPHITPALAAAITAKKPFKTIGEFNTLLAASLTKPQLDEVYPKLFVSINLNTASSADIALIPGMTRRMVHEFEEYRPYSSLAQFDKEIGKYVKPDEVARLRSYVTLN